MPDDRPQNVGSDAIKLEPLDYFPSFSCCSDLCLHDRRLTGFMDRFTLGLSASFPSVLHALRLLDSDEVESC
jgi:hypothetical protein